jgi:hypothetical protein
LKQRSPRNSLKKSSEIAGQRARHGRNMLGYDVLHHSISVEFDERRRIPLTGIVTKVEWENPSPNTLAQLGWTRTTLRVGMTVSLIGTAARDGSHKVIARKIVADGSPLAAWPSEVVAR